MTTVTELKTAHAEADLKLQKAMHGPCVLCNFAGDGLVQRRNRGTTAEQRRNSGGRAATVAAHRQNSGGTAADKRRKIAEEWRKSCGRAANSGGTAAELRVQNVRLYRLPITMKGLHDGLPASRGQRYVLLYHGCRSINSSACGRPDMHRSVSLHESQGRDCRL